MKQLTIAAAFLFSASAFSQSTWSLDKAHSKLGFSTVHLLVSDSEGRFKSFNSKVTSTKDDFADAQIELTAETNSVNTDEEKRDEHLKSPDFFDAAKYPTLTFKSKSFKKVDGKKYKLSGDLTLHGVTKPVELDVIFNGTAIHPYTKKSVAGFKVMGKIKRSDFNIASSTPSAVVSDDVTINTNIEYIKD